IEEGAPTEVFLHLRPSGGARSDRADAVAFASVLAEMYARWADRCGMHLDELEASDGEFLFAISGLGCGSILLPEAGLHVLEVVDRDQIQVAVAPRRPSGERTPPGTLRDGRDAVARLAAAPVVVRRYRPGKSSLVRDTVRGYRTGRLD